MTRLEQAMTFASTPDGFAQVWSMLGLPGEPKRIMCSPFRPDSKPSFSVYERGGKTVAHDFASGESWDAIDLVQNALNASKADASKWLMDAFGPKKCKPIMLPAKAIARASQKTPEPLQPCKLESTIRSIHRPTEPELERLCELRKYPSIHGLRLMSDRGMLICGTVYGEPVWAVMDGSHNNVRYRRFCQGDWPKSQSATGSHNDWIVAEPDKHAVIVLTEGEADCLAAACLMAWDYIEHPDMWKTLCDKVGFGFFTKSNKYHPECLSRFKGKSVLICPQNEMPSSGKPGLQMALSLGKQLDQHGAKVRFWIPPIKGMDLNNYASQLSEGDSLENSQAFRIIPCMLASI